MVDESIESLDDIDRSILRILAEDPRLPYSDIAAQLESEGHEMSSEGVRYRVSKLFDVTSVHLLTSPKEHGWNVVRMTITVDGDGGVKDDVFDRMAEMPVWLNCRVLGSFDMYAVATTASISDADELVTKTREIDGVESVEYALETDRHTDIKNYLSF
jgi:DNA-binding Lrp family transcriptional regulator